MVCEIKYFYRMSPAARINVVKDYNPKALRIRNGNYELIIRNWSKKQIWLPLDYCMKGEFTAEQKQIIRNRINEN